MKVTIIAHIIYEVLRGDHARHLQAKRLMFSNFRTRKASDIERGNAVCDTMSWMSLPDIKRMETDTLISQSR